MSVCREPNVVKGADLRICTAYCTDDIKWMLEKHGLQPVSVNPYCYLFKVPIIKNEWVRHTRLPEGQWRKIKFSAETIELLGPLDPDYYIQEWGDVQMEKTDEAYWTKQLKDHWYWYASMNGNVIQRGEKPDCKFADEQEGRVKDKKHPICTYDKCMLGFTPCHGPLCDWVHKDCIH